MHAYQQFRNILVKVDTRFREYNIGNNIGQFGRFRYFIRCHLALIIIETK